MCVGGRQHEAAFMHRVPERLRKGKHQEIPGQGLAMAHNHGIGPKSARAAGRPWAPPSPGRKEVSGLEMERETQMLKVHKTVCMLSGETPLPWPSFPT